jgi:hypothetical protein
MKAMLCIVTISGVVAVATPAKAQPCQENFQVEGVVLLTALNYRTWQSFPGIDHRKALNSLRSAMLAEGFINVDMDRAGGALTAFQETSGSGRPQTLRVTARRIGGATRVDAVFSVQQGQAADATVVRGAICRVVAAVLH